MIFGDWNTVDDVIRDFFNLNYGENVEEELLKLKQNPPFNDMVVIVAWYTYEDYYGDAYVLYTSGGKLYEVTGGHCSCNGLEGQWEPEEVSVEYLTHRLENGIMPSSAVPYIEDYVEGFK